ncbi:MAG TPA: hypothetical protein VF443_10235, partial [Nitrospira sp.]
GRVKTIYFQSLLEGISKSCGCLNAELIAARSITHGEQRGRRVSRELNIWRKILKRCLKPTDPAYADYGGRGIIVEWRTFESFLHDMGRAPKGTTIDRVDNNGPYAKWNCRWASARVQANNRRSNHRLDFGRQSLTIADWARQTNLPQARIVTRLARGWTVEDALTRPLRITRQTIAAGRA